MTVVGTESGSRAVDRPLRIGIVEDDPVFATDFVQRLKDQVNCGKVTVWRSAEAFLAQEQAVYRTLDLLFVDVRLPGVDGIKLAAGLTGAIGLNQLKIVVLTTVNTEQTIFRALRAGIVGYLHKPELHNLPDVVNTVMSGGAMISPNIALRVLHAFHHENGNWCGDPDDGYEHLSPREMEVLARLVEGRTTRESAEDLGISHHTVRVHVRNIYRKLTVCNKVELVHRAAELGLVEGVSSATSLKYGVGRFVPRGNEDV